MMARCRSVMEALIFLLFTLQLSSAVKHTLQYFYTEVTGVNFPEFTLLGQVDGEQFNYYDSNIRKDIPKTEWIRKVEGDDPSYWESQTQKLQDSQENFKLNVNKVMQRFNHTTGVHTVQWMSDCELDDDGTTEGYSQYGYDGEDFISLDMKGLTWIAPKPQALLTKKKWEEIEARFQKNYLETTCIDWLKKFVSYGKEILERKVPPTASVFQKHSSFPEVVCHATGFFPKEVMISWQKDGEDVHEDVEFRETLPNQDGSFQTRSILKVSAEELQKHTYTCVIEHSSLEKEMLVDLKDGGSDGGLIGIIVGIIVALVVLVAVVAGIVVWKKKNSGFKPVPPKPSSEGDSSSNNS
ncbi:BOLA class I histocompatibility antigen, alpha chain BL3-6-like isoform X3 [Silurus meridionalis]|uniref:BOLA class I histocompatibility antigen, alpha chain BL3-6-like isoform X3 n=1 Tax=Silurus meridionalis TaxID=175797 RepID=UPI001EECCB0B|nr:BOLA class I histocompatibility antigen, alpha chain BL3-6-like isoform X3 [Silurus meridionalis]